MPSEVSIAREPAQANLTIRLNVKFSRVTAGRTCPRSRRAPIFTGMKLLTRLVFSAAMAVMSVAGAAHGAEDALPDPPILSAEETKLDQWLWLKRPVVVFADSPADPRYVEQMQLILERIDALTLRDVVVITDTDPAGRSDIRRKLRPRGFMLVVLAKDGTVVIRKPAPWDVREISRSIDKLPLRQQEIKDRRDALRAQ